MPCLLSSTFCARKPNRPRGSCSVTSYWYSYTSVLNMDGNGRRGRFLMNLMMASGYPWTVIAVVDRKIYMEGLEKASVGEDVVPFWGFPVQPRQERTGRQHRRRIMKLCGEKEDVAGWLACQN
jgi:hypothetical protein